MSEQQTFKSLFSVIKNKIKELTDENFRAYAQDKPALFVTVTTDCTIGRYWISRFNRAGKDKGVVMNSSKKKLISLIVGLSTGILEIPVAVMAWLGPAMLYESFPLPVFLGLKIPVPGLVFFTAIAGGILNIAAASLSFKKPKLAGILYIIAIPLLAVSVGINLIEPIFFIYLIAPAAAGAGIWLCFSTSKKALEGTRS